MYFTHVSILSLATVMPGNLHQILFYVNVSINKMHEWSGTFWIRREYLQVWNSAFFSKLE